ncbi:F0F1 ATP synthase subunit delta [Mycoplasma marinum]|uniref:ATP synthase subunit delta n=1 Tax=Mycoplasma marinum TaxID=1937190 RepID=A0A4R0XVX5_9MOLU|nr:F0F1 ATP synthase subunit delta [Mycoplasma marinum]TCG12035.1 ATP synthase F1 subunit delta [Mycoplasma marinum]
MQEYINGYSLALLDIAKEEKKLSEYKEQSTIIVDVLTKNSGYVEILSSYNIETKKKLDLAKETFGGKLEQSLENFILLLVERKKTKYIIPSLKKMISFINDINDIHEGIVYSVKKLTAKQIKGIEETSSKTLGFAVTLTNKIDIELISGIKVVVEDQVLDNSVTTKINKLRQQLLEGQVQ